MVIEVTDGLADVERHMDNVLIWGATQEEHDVRMHTVLERTQKAGITLDTDKCEFTKHEVKFLGDIISADKMRPNPDKTRAVQDMEEPINIIQLRRFMVGKPAWEVYPTSIWKRQTTERPVGKEKPLVLGESSKKHLKC